MRILYILTLSLLLLIGAAGYLPAQSEKPDPATFKEGTEYFLLAEPRPMLMPEIEVTAFFWYGCGSCYNLDPLLFDWAQKLPEDVRFTLLPMTDTPPLDVHARIFLTLEKMGLGREAHQAVFDRFQIARRPINVPEQLPELADVLKVNDEDLIKTYNSPEVSQEMEKMDKIMLSYNIQGVPSMVIDGRYVFDLGTAHGSSGYFGLADRLIEERRQERRAKAGN